MCNGMESAMEICRMEMGKGCNGNSQWMTLRSHRTVVLLCEYEWFQCSHQYSCDSTLLPLQIHQLQIHPQLLVWLMSLDTLLVSVVPSLSLPLHTLLYTDQQHSSEIGTIILYNSMQTLRLYFGLSYESDLALDAWIYT